MLCDPSDRRTTGNTADYLMLAWSGDVVVHSVKSVR